MALDINLSKQALKNLQIMKCLCFLFHFSLLQKWATLLCSECAGLDLLGGALSLPEGEGGGNRVKTYFLNVFKCVSRVNYGAAASDDSA